MGIMVSLRTSSQYSLFKRMIYSLVDSLEPKKIIISSGYFQERSLNSSYKVLDEVGTHLVKGYAQSATLCELLYDNQVEDITIIGARGDLPGYQNFVSDMRAEMQALHANQNQPICPQIHAYLHNQTEWHAKVILFIDSNDDIIGGIVGSSNFTRRAYGDSFPVGTNNSFNMEADTFIFADVHWDNVYTAAEMISGTDNQMNVFLARDVHRNPETDSLNDIYDKIKNLIYNTNDFTTY